MPAPLVLVVTRSLPNLHPVHLSVDLPRLPAGSTRTYGLRRLKDRFVACASVERAKELTKQITAADDWRDVAALLREDENVNLRHLTTALYFITKRSRVQGNISHDKGLLMELEGIARRITHSDESWSSASLTNVLQACSHLAGVRTVHSASSFDTLLSMALRILVAGPDSPLSNVEYLTILSCMVHIPESLDSPGKAAATEAMEKALTPGEGGSVQLRTKGLEGFHPRDLGQLAWALTEIKCSERTAQLVYDHCMTTVGANNLSAPALCLTCRMISMQGARERAEENLARVVATAGQPVVLRRLSSLRDSTMLLLAIARIVKSVCEEEVQIEESLAFGVKWTFAVASYRKAHPAVDRLIVALCMLIQRSLSRDPTSITTSKVPSSSSRSADAKKPEDGNVSHGVYSGILYSLALLQFPAADVITACSRGLMHIHKKLTLRTIATCTWSLAVLRYEEPRLLGVFAKRVVDDKLLPASYQNSDIGKIKGGELRETRRINKARKNDKDTAQSVSMLLYGFAVLNLLEQDGGEESDMPALLTSLMKAVKPCLEHLNTEALPVLGWSIVIAHSREGSMGSKVFESTVQAWRQAVSNAFSDIPSQGRPMIHHTEIALSLQAPHLPACGAIDNVPFEPLMELLYASGRLRRHALREWNTQSQGIALDGISLFQKQVFAAAERIIPGWQMEYWDSRLQYPVDMALPEHKIVVEADGPTHFMTNTLNAVGATALKHRLLRKLGWQVIVVPYYEWSVDGSDDAHVEYLRKKLDRLRVDIESKAADVDCTRGGIETYSTRPEQREDKGAATIIQQNAEKLETVRALQGKMTLKEVANRRRRRRTNDNMRGYM